MKPWLHKVLRPYVEEAYRIVQGSYYQSRDYDKDPPDPLGPRSPPSRSADGPSPGPKPQNSLGIFHSPHTRGLSPSLSKGKSPLAPAASPSGIPPPSLIPEGHLSLLNQILQHARKNMDWDFVMDPSSPTTTPAWDAKGKLGGVVITEGRGNTKKLAKNDGARILVMELQGALVKHPHSIPNLAKKLTEHLKEVKKQRDKEEEVSRFGDPRAVDRNPWVMLVRVFVGRTRITESIYTPSIIR